MGLQIRDFHHSGKKFGTLPKPPIEVIDLERDSNEFISSPHKESEGNGEDFFYFPSRRIQLHSRTMSKSLNRKKAKLSGPDQDLVGIVTFSPSPKKNGFRCSQSSTVEFLQKTMKKLESSRNILKSRNSAFTSRGVLNVEKSSCSRNLFGREEDLKSDKSVCFMWWT